ncbi:MSP domain protein [Teladorsagia circumcincta]|uniref:Major sperm protein n=1 Tax=Teladorsagia circumcincta TaxID=45464 RepID=A0A2G9U213_TELCI|nr:MSP domain protein [Teladorsagia circumcincta]
MPLTVEPLEAAVPAAGGKSTHQLTNNTDQRMIFKIRSTNNDEYRVRPVFGFVDPAGNASIEVTRLKGPPKDDRIVVQFAPAPKNTRRHLDRRNLEDVAQADARSHDFGTSDLSKFQQFQRFRREG